MNKKPEENNRVSGGSIEKKFDPSQVRGFVRQSLFDVHRHSFFQEKRNEIHQRLLRGSAEG